MNTIKETEFDYEAYTRENAPDPSQIRRGPELHKRRREVFQARLINHVNMEIKHARGMRHVFISYCHENKSVVDRICQVLSSNDITVWVDWNNIIPGTPWKQAIQKAIQYGDFFIACFSSEYNNRDKTHMNEELRIAVDILRQKPVDRIWFIPIKLNKCEIPDIEIGNGETLRDIQYVDLSKNWENGIEQILNIIPSKSLDQVNYADVAEKVENDHVLIRTVNGQHYFISYKDLRWDSKEISLTLSPATSEQEAFLCSLRREQHDMFAFAFRDYAMWAKPVEVAQISTEGTTVWEVRLIEDTTGKVYKNRKKKVFFENLTFDQIANMRAKRILLNEKLDTASATLNHANVFNRMLLEYQIRGELSSEHGNRLQVLTSPIPALYNQFKSKPKTFTKLARLVSVLYLKLSNTVDDVLQLDLKLVTPTELQVKFKGRQSPKNINVEPTLLELEGICSLPE